MRISDWSSYVVSSDLSDHGGVSVTKVERSRLHHHHGASLSIAEDGRWRERKSLRDFRVSGRNRDPLQVWKGSNSWMIVAGSPSYSAVGMTPNSPLPARSEEHTSELQSLMRISYAVFCLKKKTNLTHIHILLDS